LDALSMNTFHPNNNYANTFSMPELNNSDVHFMPDKQGNLTTFGSNKLLLKFGDLNNMTFTGKFSYIGT